MTLQNEHFSLPSAAALDLPSPSLVSAETMQHNQGIPSLATATSGGQEPTTAGLSPQKAAAGDTAISVDVNTDAAIPRCYLLLTFVDMPY